MSTPAQARAKSSRYRQRHKAQEAARARRWRKSRPGYSTPYVRRYRAEQDASKAARRAGKEQA